MILVLKKVKLVVEILGFVILIIKKLIRGYHQMWCGQKIFEAHSYGLL